MNTRVRMKFSVFFLLLVIGTSESIDITRLKKRPNGMENFDLQQSMGKWYIYAVSQPCTWQGGYSFKDWTLTFKTDPNGFTTEEKWRKDDSCTTTNSKASPTKSPAVYKETDQIGDIWSGTVVYVCTDYVNYAISWGCVKESVTPGMCDDYMINVKTRNPNISRKTVDKINQKLHQLWGISLSDLVLVPHSKPCDQPTRKTQQMFKTY